MTLLSYVFAAMAMTGKCSRNAARRRLNAEVVRRYGATQARLMSPRLVQLNMAPVAVGPAVP